MPGSNQPFAGGRPIETPFGNIVAPNITPDPETGIGAWSDDQFDAAVRKGIGRNGSRLYPAMPYNAYTKMSRNDVLAIRAYLNTVTPVRNPWSPNTLPFPFNIRAAMRVWNALYFKEGEYHARSTQVSRMESRRVPGRRPGALRRLPHAEDRSSAATRLSQYLQGSLSAGLVRAGHHQRARRLGLGGWAVDDIAAYLKTGHNRISAATGPMAEAVTLSTSQMTDADVNAIATYLKSLPGRGRRQPLAQDNPAMAAGGAIYRDQCSACHGLDGRGVAKLFPSIADSSMVRSTDPTTAIRIVLRGARSVATDSEPTAPGMPSYGRQLDDSQVAAVLTYMRNMWGGAAPAVAAKDVTRVRSDTAARPD